MIQRRDNGDYHPVRHKTVKNNICIFREHFSYTRLVYGNSVKLRYIEKDYNFITFILLIFYILTYISRSVLVS